MRNVLLLAALLTSVPVGRAQEKTDKQSDELAKLRKEVEALRADVKELRSELARFQGEANKQKLSGVWDWQWEYVPWHYPPPSFPATIEFTKDGKIKTSDKIEGNYKVEGNLLKTDMANKSVTWQILELDNQVLLLEEVTKDTRNMRRTRFKKK